MNPKYYPSSSRLNLQKVKNDLISNNNDNISLVKYAVKVNIPYDTLYRRVRTTLNFRYRSKIGL